MNSKLLKLELFLLFFVTIIAFVAFYYASSLPDNFLSISSQNESINYFSYYVTSLVSVIGYYTGPWVFFPFVAFAILYSFIFSKRSVGFDSVNIILLIGFSMFATYLYSPSIMGRGIYHLLSKNIEFWPAMGISLCLFCLLLTGVFRSGFKDGLFLAYDVLRNGPSKLRGVLRRFNVFVYFRNGLNRIKYWKSKIKSQIPFMLKGESHNNDTRNPSSDQPVYLYTPAEDVDEEEYLEEDLEEDYLEPGQQTEIEDTIVKKESQSSLPAIKKSKVKKVQYNDSKYYDIVTTLSHKKSGPGTNHPDDIYFEDIIQRIEDKLSEFRVEGKIINILKGPVVDTFELQLGSGVKVSKVTSAEKDLSMALLGAPIRIVYPMVGRPTVGIEVPRNPREIIYLDEVLNSQEFKNAKHHLPIAMGKNAFGETFVVDLATMPHMLVAGATGAGKSVFINSLLVSLLVKKSPNQMKLILIDPKQLELALYQNLPHLIMPVVTDAKMASISLLWAVEEMERRYSILKELGVRNLEGFNQKLKRATPEMLASIRRFYENEPSEVYELPYLVIIVDEFADLILTKAGKEIESNICRLAAKARAAGIHLVLATQRPSVDVITGLIKSNFPTRVSFRVTSSVDSRTILTQIGAEKLLGKGDMLYKHGTTCSRVHSSYVEEDEIEALTDKLADMPQEYHSGAMDFLENGGEKEQDPYKFGSHISSVSDENSDDLFQQAVQVVLEHRTASTSMLQRRLKIGYNRAANLIEEMEEKGIVGPAEGAKRRKVLVNSMDD